MSKADRKASRRRRVVVGDVHGELKALTQILVHAGLLSPEKTWRGGETILVQTGDVVDRGPHSRGAVSLLRHLQEEAAAAGGAVVRCCGNHELWLLQGYFRDANYSHPDRLADELRREIERGLLCAAYSDGVRLYTHAGLRSVVRRALLKEAGTHRSKAALFSGSADLLALADRINRVFKDAVGRGRCDSSDHCIFWVGPERGGVNNVGGIFWCDYTTIAPSEHAWDVPQVFGHTPALASKLRHARGLKLVNVDAGMAEHYGGYRAYLEITATGTLVQHSKDRGGDWERRVLSPAADPQKPS